MLHAERRSDWIVPVYDGRPRLNKPPFIYWVQALTAGAWDRLLPGSEPALPTGGIGRFRLASYLGTLAAVLTLWWIGRSMWGPGHALLAAALFASCALVMFDVRQARSDPWLTAWTVLAMGALWRIVRDGEPARARLWPAVFWLSLAMGVLTKGPVCPVVCGGAVAILVACSADRSWLRRLRPVRGLTAVAAILAAYLVSLGLLVGAGAVLRTFVDEVLWRAVTPKEGHFGPPGCHLLLLPVLFWPGSLGLGPALLHLARLWPACKPGGSGAGPQASVLRRIAGPLRAMRAATAVHGVSPELMCIAWLVPGWLVFELSMTKLPHYPLPVYPAVALLCSRGLLAGATVWQPFLRSRLAGALLRGWLGLTLACSLGVPLAAVLLLRPRMNGTAWTLVALAGVLVAILNVAVRSAVKQRRFVRAQVLAVLLTAVALPATFHFVLPNAQRLWISSRLVLELRRIDPAGTRPLAAVHYHEDSLVYLTEGRVQRLRWREVPDWIDRHTDGLLIMADVLLPGGRRVRRLAEIEGYNLGGGGYERLLIAQPDPGGRAESGADPAPQQETVLSRPDGANAAAPNHRHGR